MRSPTQQGLSLAAVEWARHHHRSFKVDETSHDLYSFDKGSGTGISNFLDKCFPAPCGAASMLFNAFFANAQRALMNIKISYNHLNIQ